MRKMFTRQLIEARREMLSIFAAVDTTLHDAVQAYVCDDKKLASKAQKKTLQIDARCANLEAVCYNLIATQGPVASDFRLLQTIINIEFNLQRMCDKVRRVARAAKHKVSSDIELPSELVEIIEQEASYVYRILGTCISVLVSNDLGVMRNLLVQDDTVHELYEEFFRAYNRMSSVELADDSSYDDLRRAIMVSRYLDRVASIAIDATSTLTFLLTGQRMSIADIAEIDEDELEALRIPSGEGVILQPVSDARCVSELPSDEISDELRALIARAAAGDDEEDAEE